jgi:prevent-host-death family protein
MPDKPLETIATIAASQARAEWAQLLNRAHANAAPLLIEKNGVPVAALISPRDLEFLLRERERREQDFAILHEMQAAFAHVPDEELEREINKAVAEARAELRAEAAERARAYADAHAS